MPSDHRPIICSVELTVSIICLLSFIYANKLSSDLAKERQGAAVHTTSTAITQCTLDAKTERMSIHQQQDYYINRVLACASLNWVWKPVCFPPLSLLSTPTSKGVADLHKHRDPWNPQRFKEMSQKQSKPVCANMQQERRYNIEVHQQYFFLRNSFERKTFPP